MPDNPEPPDLEVNLPFPDGLRVTTDEPYRIMVVSDYAGSAEGEVSGKLAGGFVRVTPDNFDQILSEAAPHVRFTLADPTDAKGKMAEVDLQVRSLADLKPKQLADKLPATAALLKARAALVDRLHGRSSPDALRSALAELSADLTWIREAVKAAPADEKPADAEEVDSLLGSLDLGGEDEKDDKPPAPPKTPIQQAVAAAAGGGVPAGEISALRRTLSEVDKRISAWLTTVLHSPQIQNLESAWRGLHWLTRNIDFRKGVRLFALHAPRASLCEAVVKKLIDPVFDEDAEAPALIAVDAQFGSSAADLEALDEVAQHAASLPAVALAGVSAGFFGVKRAWQIPTLPPLLSLFDQWQFAKWKGLRNELYARSLGVVFGRCLMREPYNIGKPGDLDFNYAEPCMGDGDLVWTSGSVAGAFTVARSVTETGWPSGMAGRVHGRIEGLPQTQGGKSGDKTFGPADTETPQPRVEEMGISGINAVVTSPDAPDALFWNGLTAARPDKPDPNGLLTVSLPYQLFAARLSNLLWELKPNLVNKSPEEASRAALAHVKNWLGIKGEQEGEADQIAVQVRPTEDDPNTQQLAITVTPPQKILPGGIPVVLGYVLK